MDAERKLRRQAKRWRDQQAKAANKFNRIDAMRADKAHSELKQMQTVLLNPTMPPGGFYNPKHAKPGEVRNV